MDDEAKAEEERIWRKRNADIRCPKCGAYTLERIPGEQLGPETHFPGIVYRVCSGCGYDAPVSRRRR